MHTIKTKRFALSSLKEVDYERFLRHMLTDERVVTFFYGYQELKDMEEIRTKAQKDFWAYFETSRAHNLPIWAAYPHGNPEDLVGWVGLVYSELTEKYGGHELQYMIHGDWHGQGVATEIAEAIIDHAKDVLGLERIVATVDVPNIGSSRVLEKLFFKNLGQIEAYGSTEMYLFEKYL